MVLYTNFSLKGKDHYKNGIVCQDASAIKEILDNWTVMATADGVGSCYKSNRGSKIAVETATQICVEHFPFDGKDEGILSLMRTAYNGAFNAIKRQAMEDDIPIEQYDTTLDLVIYNGTSKLYYGHSGDGGIFVLDTDGRYTEITRVQEGEESSSVIPLRGGNSVWEFGTFESNIAAVASFTDGIRDKLSPEMFRNQKYKIDVPLANRFMFMDVYGLSDDEAQDLIKANIEKAVKYIKSDASRITDDATMGLLINNDVLIEDPPYETPDYAEIKYTSLEHLYPSPEQLSRIARRHFLEVFLIDNRENSGLDSESELAALNKYYPLNEEEEKAYNAKYHSSIDDSKKEFKGKAANIADDKTPGMISNESMDKLFKKSDNEVETGDKAISTITENCKEKNEDAILINNGHSDTSEDDKNIVEVKRDD